MAAASQPTRPLSAPALDTISKEIGDEWQRHKRSMDKWLLATLGVGAAFSLATAFMPAAAVSAAVVFGAGGIVMGSKALGLAAAMRSLRLQRDEMLRDKAAKDLRGRIDGFERLENRAFLAAGVTAAATILAWVSWFAMPAAIPFLAPLAAGLGTCAVGATAVRGAARLFWGLAQKTDNIVNNAITTAALAAAPAASSNASASVPQTPDFNAAANAPDWSASVETGRSISVSRPLQLKL